MSRIAQEQKLSTYKLSTYKTETMSLNFKISKLSKYYMTLLTHTTRYKLTYKLTTIDS